MKFVFNFIFYGFIYYMIWRNFPVVIETFVAWADSISELVIELWGLAMSKFASLTQGAGNG